MVDPTEHILPAEDADAGFQPPKSAIEFLTQMAAAYGHSMSDFESYMWLNRVIAKFSDEQVMRALMAYMEEPGRDKKFFPRYGDILEMLEAPVDARALEELVRNGSPYEAPAIDDPVVLAAIANLGGWAQVCKQMPDPQIDQIGFASYMRRVDAAFVQATHQVNVQNRRPPPLKAIGSFAANRCALEGDGSAKLLPAPNSRPRN